MPIDRSQYQIELKTSADTAGVEKMLASAQETREAFQLLRESAADALGPIGELIDLLENPYLLAVAGATLATQVLVQALQAARENASHQIKTAMELRDVNAGRDQHLDEIQSASASAGNNETLLDSQAQTRRAADEAQHSQDVTGQGHGAESLAENDTRRLQRINEVRPQARSGTAIDESPLQTAGSTASDVRGSITRAQQRISELDAPLPDRAGGHASPEEVAKLIELNDVLIGLEENQSAQHGHLLDKIDAMMSRVQALEAAQRNTRWQSQ